MEISSHTYSHIHVSHTQTHTDTHRTEVGNDTHTTDRPRCKECRVQVNVECEKVESFQRFKNGDFIVWGTGKIPECKTRMTTSQDTILNLWKTKWWENVPTITDNNNNNICSQF